MSLATFTAVHVAISLIGIASGFVVMFGLIGGSRMDRMTAVFLSTTTLTSITGFLFPFERLTPGDIIGILSLVMLLFAIPARYLFQLAGPWRSIYIIGSALAFYFNFFVLIVQSFEKVPALKALAPTQTEPPFVIAQLVALLFFTALTVLAPSVFIRSGFVLHSPPE
ncbi:MAG TPA: hypothetical protein VMI10_19215 [Terriglobales bacterium]|nr:hypothetical protein [Terriglobales bacterium]